MILFSKHVYFGEMQNGHAFNYSPRDAVNGANYDSQVTFLRLLSTTARQVNIEISYTGQILTTFTYRPSPTTVRTPWLASTRLTAITQRH